MARRVVGKKRADQLRKVNKNVLNKKSRVRTKYGAEVEGVETKSPDDFSSVKEYNQYIRDMQQFTDRSFDYQATNKNNVRFKKSEIQDEEREIKRINRIKQKKYDEVKDEIFTDRGKPTHMQVSDQKGYMGDTRYSDYRPLNFDLDRYQDKKQYQRRINRIKDKYQGDFFNRYAIRYKHNFIKALDNVFGAEGQHLQKIVDNMDADEFVKLYHKENLSNINFIYEKQSRDIKIGALEDMFGERGYV